jgi:protein SCO1/2
MLAILLVPPSPTGLGALAEEFKVWCFGYDPATGNQPWSYIIGFAVEALVLATIVVAIWWRQFVTAVREPRQLAASAMAALTVIVGAAVAFGAARPALRDGEFPFPAERIRTSLPAPNFTLTDQDGAPVSLEQLRGRVVLVTGVYSRCGSTCPRIIREARHATVDLTEDERREITVVAVTMDPGHDTPETLRRLADQHRVSTPLFHFVTGPQRDIDRVLDDLSIARETDRRTGIIQHANVFVVVDRHGRIAYRLSLGERRERWLVAALRTLVREPR